MTNPPQTLAQWSDRNLRGFYHLLWENSCRFQPASSGTQVLNNLCYLFITVTRQTRRNGTQASNLPKGEGKKMLPMDIKLILKSVQVARRMYHRSLIRSHIFWFLNLSVFCMFLLETVYIIELKEGSANISIRNPFSTFKGTSQSCCCVFLLSIGRNKYLTRNQHETLP
jgi:hypothetical protein